MTVQIQVDEKMWAEAERLARDLDVDQEELFVNTLRETLYSLKRERERAAATAEKERQHEESYKKFPQTEGEVSEWEEIQDWGDE